MSERQEFEKVWNKVFDEGLMQDKPAGEMQFDNTPAPVETKRERRLEEEYAKLLQERDEEIARLSNLVPKYVKIRDARRQTLGDIENGHKQLGRHWAAVLSEYFNVNIPDIPAYIVCQMLVCLKVGRGSRALSFNEDHYEDQHNYTDFAKENHPLNPEYKPSPSTRPAFEKDDFGKTKDEYHGLDTSDLSEEERIG